MYLVSVVTAVTHPIPSLLGKSPVERAAVSLLIETGKSGKTEKTGKSGKTVFCTDVETLHSPNAMDMIS